MATAWPLLLLIPALQATPLQDPVLGNLQRVLHIALTACFIWLLVRAVAAGERAILRSHPIDVSDNLEARRIQTQTRVLSRVLMGGIIVLGASLVLLTFPMVQKIGTALLASAGLIGLVAGIAAKPVFGNLIAGLQIAVTQPIRLDDVVIVEGEWGRIEEIGSSYVVVRIWDERRMVVPLTWFIENPFQNWTRRSADLLGTAFLWLDYRAPVAAIRAELERICRGEALWDGRVCVTQVTETSERAIQVRLLVSARSPAMPSTCAAWSANACSISLRASIRSRCRRCVRGCSTRTSRTCRGRLARVPPMCVRRVLKMVRRRSCRWSWSPIGSAGRWPASVVLPASGRHYRKQGVAALPELTARRRRSAHRYRSAEDAARGCAVRRRRPFRSASARSRRYP